MIHVDDFLIIGDIEEAIWFEDHLQKQFEISTTIIGQDFVKTAAYLNRLITWTEGGIEVEADPEHVDVVLRYWGIGNCNGHETPVASESEEFNNADEQLKGTNATKLRRAAATSTTLQDRQDLRVP